MKIVMVNLGDGIWRDKLPTLTFVNRIIPLIGGLCAFLRVNELSDLDGGEWDFQFPFDGAQSWPFDVL
jgi:hypothetical protein